jgi:AcrR family transcriptional regulator
MAPTTTSRGRARREQLLNVTAELVAARGFHAVGIADIGAAAGVTGPAIYRHFATKQHLLLALFERVVDGLLEGARAIDAEFAQPERALERLVEAHVAFALRDRAIIAVYDQEGHNLPPEDRSRLRRTQRLYADLWTDVVRCNRPEIRTDVAAASVHAAFGLINSVADYDARLPDDELAALLTTMARAALLPPT